MSLIGALLALPKRFLSTSLLGNVAFDSDHPGNLAILTDKGKPRGKHGSSCPSPHIHADFTLDRLMPGHRFNIELLQAVRCIARKELVIVLADDFRNRLSNFIRGGRIEEEIATFSILRINRIGQPLDYSLQH